MDETYVLQPMFTYLGNKRKLLGTIEEAVLHVREQLGGRRLRAMDAFSGSTVVARLLAAHSSELHVNDLEPYAHLAARCFLDAPTEAQRARVSAHLAEMNAMTVFTPGVVATHYAPRDTAKVEPGERAFFTRENAERVDTWRAYVEERVAEDVRPWVLCPVLVQMSLHANTYGHFKAFSKDEHNVGSFARTGKRATRAMDAMELLVPVYNPHPCAVTFSCEDANALLARCERQFDLIYLDPPYNQHEYCAFYFLHNIVIDNRAPTDVNRVTGLPRKRGKSAYNSPKEALAALRALIARCVAISAYTLVSYSTDGFIKAEEWEQLLAGYTVREWDIDHRRYSTKRSAEAVDARKRVTERLFIIHA
jgi:adenine-specific DNA-methyltransferase